jgi:hypothetical protein
MSEGCQVGSGGVQEVLCCNSVPMFITATMKGESRMIIASLNH